MGHRVPLIYRRYAARAKSQIMTWGFSTVLLKQETRFFEKTGFLGYRKTNFSSPLKRTNKLSLFVNC